MNLSVVVGGVHFEHPLINAAGTCKRLEDVSKLARSAVAGITIGSATLEEKGGNSGNVWHPMPHSTINSLGLPNPGHNYYARHLPEMVRIAHDHGKPVIFSVAGNTPREFEILAEVGANANVDFRELNVGCPNNWVHGQHGQVFSFDTEMMLAILARFRPEQLHTIGIKFSPYSDPTMIPRVVNKLLVSYPVAYVATANTFPNCFAYQDSWRPAINSENVPKGYGGGAGRGFKIIGLGQVRQFREAMDAHTELKEKAIIGIGGVYAGRDVLEYRSSRANLVGVASAYMEDEDPRVFSEILTKYVDFAEKQSAGV